MAIRTATAEPTAAPIAIKLSSTNSAPKSTDNLW